MGDTKDTWKVKTLDEILQEKKRRRALEEKTDPKPQTNVNQNYKPTTTLRTKTVCFMQTTSHLEINSK